MRSTPSPAPPPATRAPRSGLLRPPGAGAALFLLFAVLVLAKLAVVRALVLGDPHPLSALLLESAFVLAVLGLVELLGERRFALYLAVDAAFSLLLAVTAIYAGFFARVFSLDAVRFAGEAVGARASVLEALRPWHLLLAADLAAGLAAVPFLRRRGWWRLASIDARVVGVAAAAGVTAIALLATGTGRAEVGSSIAIARERGLIRYQLAGLTRPRQRRGLEFDTSDPAEVEAAFIAAKGLDRDEPTSSVHGVAAGRNLIVVQLESIQRLPVGLKVGGVAVTPNLDALAAEGWWFPNTYSQAGMGNTSDVEFMLNAGLYPAADKTSAERVGSHRIPGLPRVLSEQGYVSEAFHANDPTFWDRDILYPALGFETLHGRDFFGEEDLVGLGPSDEVLVSAALGRMSQLSAEGIPFYASLVTLTPHHPFQLPTAKRGLALPATLQGTLVGRYLESARYEDRCIGELVQGLKDAGLWERSMLVLYGDHFGLDPGQLAKEDQAALHALLGRQYSLADKFNIPFMAVVPGERGTEVERVIGQIDIMPTIADLMGLDLSRVPHAGRSAFARTPNVLAQRYHLPSGSYLTEEVLVVPQTGYHDAQVMRLRDGKHLDADVLQRDASRAAEVLRVSDAYVRQLTGN